MVRHIGYPRACSRRDGLNEKQANPLAKNLPRYSSRSFRTAAMLHFPQTMNIGKRKAAHFASIYRSAKPDLFTNGALFCTALVNARKTELYIQTVPLLILNFFKSLWMHTFGVCA